MTTPLGVLVLDDLPDNPVLCGRAALDWLLDTVEALAPSCVTDLSLAPPPADPPPVTLVLPRSAPLLRPATLRRAVRLLRESYARAVVVELPQETPWWAEAGPSDPPAVLAIAGPVPPDVLGLSFAAARQRLAAPGETVLTAQASAIESLSVADPHSLVRAQNALYLRIAGEWLDRGVIVEDPATARIDATVTIAAGARIRPNTELIGTTSIGAGSSVGPTTTIRDSRIGADCTVQYAVCQHVEVGDGANVGPFCWLRSGTRLGARGRAGAFVELADSVIGEGTSIPHLGGLFSADVGRDCNIAGMSAPANFDGAAKHRIRIGDNVSIGAGNILVAPISIGDGSSTAAGSVITQDVPDGALGMARAEQRNFAGWSALARRRAAAAAPSP